MRMNKNDFENKIKVSSLVKLFELGKVSAGTAALRLGSWHTKHFSINETGYLKTQIHPHLFHRIWQMNNDNPNNLWQDSIYH